MFIPVPHLIVQPDDGVAPVRDFINTAKKSLLIKQFTFSEETLLQSVVDRKNAGVDVRIILPQGIDHLLPCQR